MNVDSLGNMGIPCSNRLITLLDKMPDISVSNHPGVWHHENLTFLNQVVVRCSSAAVYFMSTLSDLDGSLDQLRGRDDAVLISGRKTQVCTSFDIRHTGRLG